MSTEFETQFEEALDSLEEASDDELAEMVEEYRAEVEGSSSEYRLQISPVIEGPSSNSTSLPYTESSVQISSDAAQEFANNILKATYQLGQVVADVLENVSVFVSKASEETTKRSDETTVRITESDVSLNVSIDPLEDDESTYDMVA